MADGFIESFVKNVQVRLFFWLSFNGLTLIGVYWIAKSLVDDPVVIAGMMAFTALFIAAIIGSYVGKSLAKPTQFIAQAVMHVAPGEHLVDAPNLDTLHFGSELVNPIVRQVYDYAASTQSKSDSAELLPASLFDQLPVALIGLDEQQVINLANNKAVTLSQADSLTGTSFTDSFSFNSEDEVSLAQWLQNISENSLSELKTWQKVEVKALHNNQSLGYFDIAVSFNKHSSSGIETLITFYDHSAAYKDEADSISFIAMAVHELRTPVTILRGYVEAFEEELADVNKPELNTYLKKMNASADTLSSFIANILNVAKINQGQLSLSLTEGSWSEVLPQIVDNLRNRATVNGKQIELRMESDLPTVAMDRMTISEVITNLVDNSIKYSPDNTDPIRIISKLNAEGLVETTVEDHGVGIPEGVMPHLFSKFSRNHRNKAQIGGTGLGLYLSKAIVTAHSGNIWASSKEGEGSTFGFTLVPYERLAKDLETHNNENIVRTTHGWIKNHSMQRR